MRLRTRWFTGLRLRLFLTFGLLSLLFNGFLFLVFLNTEKAMLTHQLESEVRVRLAAVFAAEPRPDYPSLGLNRPGRLAWGPAGTPAHAWKVGDVEDRALVEAPRWFGPAPVELQLAGTQDGRPWRLAVGMQREASVLHNSARVMAFYVFLNTAVLLGAVFFWVTRLVIRRIDTLGGAMTAVHSASQFKPLPPSAGDEIGQLTASFNELMERLRSLERRNIEAWETAVTAYHRLEDAQNQLVVTEKVASLGRLSANLAHEIGNPLSAVLGYLRLLKGEDADHEEIRRRCLAEAERIDGIIRNLLSFAPRGDRSEEVSTVAELVEGVAERMRGLPRFSHVRFSLAPMDPAWQIPSGNGAVEQVLVNLCINAADAMQGQGEIRLEVEADDERIRILVANDGPGIPPEDRTRIFEPFYSTKPDGEGTGLGLAISHQIVQTLHGALSLAGGEPTCFVVELPRRDRVVTADPASPPDVAPAPA